MSKKREWVLRITGTVLLHTLWTASIGPAIAAPPRTAGATVTRSGPVGNTATRQTTATANGQGGYTAGSTVTGPAGNTAARQQSGVYNAATQTYTRSGTTTGPSGNQSSFNTSAQATGNGLNRTATHTGPNGQSVNGSRAVTVAPAPAPGN